MSVRASQITCGDDGDTDVYRLIVEFQDNSMEFHKELLNPVVSRIAQVLMRMTQLGRLDEAPDQLCSFVRDSTFPEDCGVFMRSVNNGDAIFRQCLQEFLTVLEILTRKVLVFDNDLFFAVFAYVLDCLENAEIAALALKVVRNMSLDVEVFNCSFVAMTELRVIHRLLYYMGGATDEEKSGLADVVLCIFRSFPVEADRSSVEHMCSIVEGIMNSIDVTGLGLLHGAISVCPLVWQTISEHRFFSKIAEFLQIDNRGALGAFRLLRKVMEETNRTNAIDMSRDLDMENMKRFVDTPVSDLNVTVAMLEFSSIYILTNGRLAIDVYGRSGIFVPIVQNNRQWPFATRVAGTALLTRVISLGGDDQVIDMMGTGVLSVFIEFVSKSIDENIVQLILGAIERMWEATESRSRTKEFCEALASCNGYDVLEELNICPDLVARLRNSLDESP